MKQVTGNNQSHNSKRLSIRLRSGGHSFSCDSLPRAAQNDDTDIEFTVITHKCTLVPAEAFEDSDAAEYLAIEGLACTKEERPVCAADNDTIAVMAVDAACADTVACKFGRRASFTTPLLKRYSPHGKALHIYRADGVVFMKLYDDRTLKYAAAVRAADTDEVLYYAALVNERFGLNDYIIYISGDDSDTCRKVLRKYFTDVRCE